VRNIHLCDENRVKTVTLWNIITIQNNCFLFKCIKM